MNSKITITVFEHQKLKVDQEVDGVIFTKKMLETLQRHYGEGVPYFSLVHRGVQFNEHVGVMQVGYTLYEILPKTDKSSSAGDKVRWRKLLIDMLLVTKTLDFHTPSSSSLSLKRNSILDLYIEYFLSEVSRLMRLGLIKKYRQKESNCNSLKGSLIFSKHIQHNLVHQERFYTRHTNYDRNHLLHEILFKAISLIRRLPIESTTSGKVNQISLDFPEQLDIGVSHQLFNRIKLNRKSAPYRNAIEIAKLLLLQYHPDVSKGQDHVLTLMFDMNQLWEKFVYTSIKKYGTAHHRIKEQDKTWFWKPIGGTRSKIKPDIVLDKGMESCVVLDAKWKVLKDGRNPSPEDLRQLYVYHDYYKATKVSLIYPGSTTRTSGGHYLDPGTGQPTEKHCAVINLNVDNQVVNWQQNIAAEIDLFIRQ